MQRILGCLALALAVGCSASSGGDGSGGAGAAGGTAGSGGSGGTAASGGSAAGGSGGGIIDAGTGDGAGGAGDGGVCTQNVDIVFVMDVSTSMGPFLNKLAQEINVVDSAVQALKLPAPPQYGLAVFVDDVLLMNSGAPYADVNILKSDFQSWSQFTASNQQVKAGGFNTTWPENSLDALYLAATSFQWRPKAGTLRIVIHTTDDTFWEGPSSQNGVAINYDYPQTLKILQDQEIRVFSFASKLGGSCECLDVSGGWFGPFNGSPAMPQATGGGVFELDQVLSGQISLSASINGAVVDSLCKPYPTPR